MSKIQGIRDRGAAKYFHGRENILAEFQNLIADSDKSRGGTIFLIQGPPGVGKTALLAKCWDEAEERGWGVAEIDPEDLWNPDELRKTLGLPPQERKVGKTTGWGLDKIFNFSRKTETRINAPLDTPTDILKLKTAPVLLILDEAQHLGEDGGVPEEHRKSVRTLLKRIHNGRLGRPVILLAGGLGMTFQALAALGISRIAKKCKFNMGPLEEGVARGVIQDWLKEEGKAKGDMTAWVDAIEEETYGWPQHIIAYTEPASDHLKENDGEMTGAGLATVLEQGRENRREYYEGRMAEFVSEERTSFAQIISSVPQDRSLKKTEILAHLAKEYGEEKAKELFFRSVQKGVFYYSAKVGDYSVSIPSMRDWLLENYLPKEISEQQPESKDQSELKQLPEPDQEKEGSQKELENHKTDGTSPGKEEGKEPATPKSGKDNPGQDQDPPQGKDPSDSDRDTDMGMER